MLLIDMPTIKTGVNIFNTLLIKDYELKSWHGLEYHLEIRVADLVGKASEFESCPKGLYS
jgi:hypothetical protein